MDEKQFVGNFEKILKISDENSIEKLTLIILGKFVTKIRPIGKTSFFNNNFFGFGGYPPFPLGYAPGAKNISNSNLSCLRLIQLLISLTTLIQKRKNQRKQGQFKNFSLNPDFISNCIFSWFNQQIKALAYAGKKFEGFKVMGGLIWVRGRRPPEAREFLKNLQKNFKTTR